MYFISGPNLPCSSVLHPAVLQVRIQDRTLVGRKSSPHSYPVCAHEEKKCAGQAAVRDRWMALYLCEGPLYRGFPDLEDLEGHPGTPRVQRRGGCCSSSSDSVCVKMNSVPFKNQQPGNFWDPWDFYSLGGKWGKQFLTPGNMKANSFAFTQPYPLPFTSVFYLPQKLWVLYHAFLSSSWIPIVKPSRKCTSVLCH